MFDFKTSLDVGDLNEKFNNEILKIAFPKCEIIMNSNPDEMKNYDVTIKTKDFERTIEYKFDMASRKYGNFFVEVFMYDESRGIYPGCFMHTKADYFFHSNISNIWVRETDKMKEYLKNHEKVLYLKSWVKDNNEDINRLLGECAFKKIRASKLISDTYGEEVADIVKIVPNIGSNGYYCSLGIVENIEEFNNNCGFKYHWPNDFNSAKQKRCKNKIIEYLDLIV